VSLKTRNELSAFHEKPRAPCGKFLKNHTHHLIIKIKVQTTGKSRKQFGSTQKQQALTINTLPKNFRLQSQPEVRKLKFQTWSFVSLKTRDELSALREKTIVHLVVSF